MNELRDRIETFLTISVSLFAIGLAWVGVCVVVGLSFGLAVRAARFVTG
jgi:hypothetical protein